MTATAQVLDNDTGDIIPAPQEGIQTANLFATSDPTEVIVKATAVAEALATVLEQRKLYTLIKNRKHVRVEGWTLLGAMLGVFPRTEWTHRVEGGWEARVEAVTRSGEVVGAGEMECLKSEKTWGDRDDYALRSMAQTRATSKALKGPLSFVVTLAGFDATPAEEVPGGGFGGRAEGPDTSAILAAAQQAWPAESQFPTCPEHGALAAKTSKKVDGPFLACPTRNCTTKPIWPDRMPAKVQAAMVAAAAGDAAPAPQGDDEGEYVDAEDLPF